MDSGAKGTVVGVACFLFSLALFFISPLMGIVAFFVLRAVARKVIEAGKASGSVGIAAALPGAGVEAAPGMFVIPGTGENSAVLQDIRGAAMESSKPDGWADRQKAAGKDERAAVKEERRNRKMHCPRCGAGDVYLINGKMKCHGCGYEEGKLF